MLEIKVGSTVMVTGKAKEEHGWTGDVIQVTHEVPCPCPYSVVFRNPPYDGRMRCFAEWELRSGTGGELL